MAKQTAGESKTPLIVALAFFVLSTLILGVLFYMETDKSATARDAAKKAQDEKATADKLRSAEKEKMLLYKVALGVHSQEDFDSLKNMLNRDEVRKEYAALRQGLTEKLPQLNAKGAQDLVGTNTQFSATVDDVLKWNWPEGANLEAEPERTVAESVVSTMARQQLAMANLKAAERRMEQTNKAFQDMSAQAQQAKQTFEAKTNEIPAKVNEAVTKYAAEAAATRKQFGEETKLYADAKREMSEELGKKDITIGAQQSKLQGQQQQINRLEASAERSEDQFQFDRPHGRILRRTGNMVDIDLGYADNLPIGERFTIQPSDTPDKGIQSRMRQRVGSDGQPLFDGNQPLLEMVPKGKIEVIEVLGPNLARARVTSESDPIRERIMTGDLLYNVSWRKGSADKIALFGVFDTNGDGIDDIQTVIRDLRQMGIVVSAYYNLEQRKWLNPETGRATRPTEQLVYAVQGAYPAPFSGDSLADARGEITKLLDIAKTEAREKGVKVVKSRDYFPRIGYEMQHDVADDRINQAYARYLRGTTEPSQEDPGR